jgi:hypothetical protein
MAATAAAQCPGPPAEQDYEQDYAGRTLRMMMKMVLPNTGPRQASPTTLTIGCAAPQRPAGTVDDKAMLEHLRSFEQELEAAEESLVDAL